MKTAEYDKLMETREWVNKIPFINFPSDWQIQIIPPFSGATSRFRIKKIDNEKTVSVYLDCYDHLGCFGEPYWEIYPYQDDTFRCAMNDTDALINDIEESLNEE